MNEGKPSGAVLGGFFCVLEACACGYGCICACVPFWLGFMHWEGSCIPSSGEAA